MQIFKAKRGTLWNPNDGIRVTRWVPLVEQELLTLPEHLSSPPVFSGVCITRSLGLYVCFVNRCLSICSFSFGHCVVRPSLIYGFWLPPFGIFKLFLIRWCLFLLDQYERWIFYSAHALKQQSISRHVTQVRHIIPIPYQPVFVLTPLYCMLDWEVSNTNFIVFGLTQQGFNPGNYHTGDQSANNYIIKGVIHG